LKKQLMVDVVSSAIRSRMMSGIRSRHTKPEILLRRALHALGLRFRLHVRGLPGSPDIVLPRWRAAIFVQGCFWHRHADCRLTATPSTRPEFWQKKFCDNVTRDARNQADLVNRGWRVAIIWECAVRDEGAVSVAEHVRRWLVSDSTRLIMPSEDDKQIAKP
jgi:DNA mismatch endonuclease (patch repair protein)